MHGFDALIGPRLFYASARVRPVTSFECTDDLLKLDIDCRRRGLQDAACEVARRGTVRITVAFQEENVKSGGGGDKDVPASGGGGDKEKCAKYMIETGCEWTKEHSCPGQPEGRKGLAKEEDSLRYKCCCKEKMWEKNAPTSASDAKSFGGSQELGEKHLSKPASPKESSEAPKESSEAAKEESSEAPKEESSEPSSTGPDAAAEKPVKVSLKVHGEITEEIEAHQHRKTMSRIEKKIKSFEGEIDRLLGVKTKEVPLDGTSPMLVRIPGAEPMWLRANWKNPMLDTPKPKAVEDEMTPPEQDEVADATEHSAASLLPIALFSTALIPRGPFRSRVRSSLSLEHRQKCSAAAAEAFLWPKLLDAALAK